MTPTLSDLQAEIAEQAKTIAELRAALEQIAGFAGPYHHPFPESGERYASFAVMTSREALGQRI